MRTTRTIYISDFFTVPNPKHATSHENYLKKRLRRRILWALLPDLFQSVLLLISAVLIVGGISVLACGLGG